MRIGYCYFHYLLLKKGPKVDFVFNGIRFSLAGPMEWITGLLSKYPVHNKMKVQGEELYISE